jgi:hypothetical protein
MNREKKIITFIIIFLLLLSSCFLINKTFSRFGATVVGSGETDVAKWELLVDDNQQSVNLLPGGDSVDYTLRLTSNSEVSSCYSIELSNLPSSVRISLDNGNYITPIDGVVAFENSGCFKSSTSSVIKNHTLSFKAISGAESVSNRKIDVDIIAIQDNI